MGGCRGACEQQKRIQNLARQLCVLLPNRFCSYDVEHEVMQRNAEGTLCKTTSWWEGAPGAACCWGLAAAASEAARVGLRAFCCPAAAGPCLFVCAASVLACSFDSFAPYCCVLPVLRWLVQAAYSAAAWRARSWGCSSRGASCAATPWLCGPRCAPPAAAQRWGSTDVVVSIATVVVMREQWVRGCGMEAEAIYSWCPTAAAELRCHPSSRASSAHLAYNLIAPATAGGHVLVL